METGTVTLPTRLVAFLVEGALVALWTGSVRAWDDGVVPDPDEARPCCARCCGPCSALLELDTSGQLSVILAGTADGTGWWDSAGQRVDPAYLAERIAPYHEHGDMADPNRCTDYGQDHELCGQLGPRGCREHPEHEACRAERVCGLDDEHDGPCSWDIVW